MKTLGVTLLMIGFFAAAFVTVRHADSEQLAWQTIEWGWYSVAFVLGLAGVIVLRILARSSGSQAQKLEADLDAMVASLSNLVARLGAMNADRQNIGVYEVYGRLDDELMTDLGTFVEARESLIQLYGLNEYADVMSRFALGERNINRAWSASADGYVDEVWICTQRAQEQMELAHGLLKDYAAKA